MGSHVDSTVNDKFLEWMNEKYGVHGAVTATRGKVHEYLGMAIDYGTPGKVSIRMDDYIKNMLDDLPEVMGGTANTPAAEHLFQVDDTAKKLDADDAELFHSTTAKLLFLCKRARPDIQTPIAFLCTQVIQPDVDD